MKKLTLIFTSILVLTTLGISQGIKMGVKGIVNATGLFNKNVSDAGDEQDYALSFGHQEGATFGINVNENIGFAAEFFFGTHTQKYVGETILFDYNSDVKLNTIDIPFLFRLGSSEGAFMEIGAQYSLLTKAEYSATVSLNGIPGSTTSPPVDVKSAYSGSNISGVLGFGADISLSENFYINTALRFTYGFTDYVGTDGFGNDLNTSSLYGANPLYLYEKKEPTNSAAAGFLLGLTYRVDY